MAYQIIQAPFTLQFHTMSEKELTSYSQWFHAQIPLRVEELKAVVNESSAFGIWSADDTPESLVALDRWFATQVEKRPTSNEERQEVAYRLSRPLVIPDWTLTDRTVSLAIDIGMYLSAVIIASHPSASWNQLFGSKTHIDYGQPILVGFGTTSFNPVRAIVVLAYGIASRQRALKGLHELYEMRSRMSTQGSSNSNQSAKRERGKRSPSVKGGK
jgi:hypothetical protein